MKLHVYSLLDYKMNFFKRQEYEIIPDGDFKIQTLTIEINLLKTIQENDNKTILNSIIKKIKTVNKLNNNVTLELNLIKRNSSYETISKIEISTFDFDFNSDESYEEKQKIIIRRVKEFIKEYKLDELY